ncbi:MAG: hypothetical protein GY940_41725 [bacterium]|nr:hypothetical protein [bacterium]
MILITDESIDSFLMDSNLKITNSHDDKKISEPLLPFKYDETKFTEGFSIYKGAYDAQKLVKIEHSEQLGATDAFNKAFNDTDKLYMQDISIALVAFRGSRRLLDASRLDENRKSTYTGWTGQAPRFYETTLEDPEATVAMDSFGITVEMLQARKDMVDNVIHLKMVQMRESADAQDAVKLRDEALEKLQQWIADLVTVARVALADSPQLLEKLNIKVVS